MSYSIRYIDDVANTFPIDPLFEGGILTVGGQTDTQLNVTYNYSWYYYMFLDEKEGIRWLYKKKGKDCIERLTKAIKPFIKHEPYTDYWADTPGNCIKPLKIFLEWCQEYPEGEFDGD